MTDGLLSRRQLLAVSPVLAAAACSKSEHQLADKLAKFMYVDQNGNHIQIGSSTALRALLGNRPTIVAFGWTGCSAEAPELHPALAQLSRQQDMNIVVINLIPETDLMAGPNAYYDTLRRAGVVSQGMTVLNPVQVVNGNRLDGSNQTANLLARDLGIITPPDRPLMHSTTLLLFDRNGVEIRRASVATPTAAQQAVNDITSTLQRAASERGR